MNKRTKKADGFKNNPARALLYLNAFLWFAYSIYIYHDMAVVNKNGLSADIATIFVFGNAVLMLVSGILLGRQRKWAYYFVFVVVILNTLLTLVNLSDVILLVVFVIDLIILGMLLSLRKSYLSEP
jgi:hypothetical protein